MKFTQDVTVMHTKVKAGDGLDKLPSRPSSLTLTMWKTMGILSDHEGLTTRNEPQPTPASGPVDEGETVTEPPKTRRARKSSD